MAEQTLILGAENHLVATLTRANPTGADSPRCVAILSNSGVIPRIGPHRMNVRLARRFAEMGIPSIRFDMSGLGDSRRSSSSLPIERQWVADTRAVMDTAQSHFGCDRFFMVGFCSGAEVAHLVALEDRRLRAAVLWDWYSHPTLQSRLRTALYKLRRAGPRRAVRRLLARAWPAMRSARWAASEAQDSAAAISQDPSRDEYTGRIQTLVDDGVELLFAYSGGEVEKFNHRGQFRSMFGRYAFFDKVAFNYLEVSDHLVTRREAQQSFTDMVVQWLEQRVLVAARPATPPR
jgi:hypothetical protein